MKLQVKHLKSNEIRVGNNVLFNKEIIKLDGSLFAMYLQNELGMPFYPIPLTEEWLIKLGFKKNNYWFKNDNMLRFGLIDNQLHCSIGNDESGFLYNRINYVHQLQNLYFALTGEQLEFKQ